MKRFGVQSTRMVWSAFVMLGVASCGVAGTGELPGARGADAGGWDVAPIPVDGGGPWRPDADVGGLDAGIATRRDASTPPFPDAGPSDSGIATCVPGETAPCQCSSGQGSRLCRDDGTFGCCTCWGYQSDPELLQCLERGIVGRWVGSVASPFGPVIPVEVVFRADGTYSAHCLEEGCVAFYYGTDADLPGKVYRLTDIRADIMGEGEIVIAFSLNNMQVGTLTSILLVEQESRLYFDFWGAWLPGRPGPFRFELDRQP